MEKQNSVMGIIAASPKPDWRGFLILGIAIGAPIAIAAEILWRWFS